MKKARKEEQIIGIVREAEQSGDVQEVCRKHGIHQSTLYAWRRKFGGMDVAEAKRMRELEKENAQLRQLAGDQALALQVMKAELKKRGWG